MGGGGGGRISRIDVQRLEEVAKNKLAEAASDGAKHVFISFAHEDLGEVNLLRGQAKNDKNDLVFDDFSVKEPYNSKNSDYIKSQIREKIDRVSVTIVYLSNNSANSDWVNWEIEESFRRNKGVIGVYKGNAPKALPKAFINNKCKAVPWAHDAIAKAISEADKNR